MATTKWPKHFLVGNTAMHANCSIKRKWHTHTHTQTGPHSESVCVGSCISISFTGQCVRVCVCKWRSVRLHSINRVCSKICTRHKFNTNKQAHTHKHIHAYLHMRWKRKLRCARKQTQRNGSGNKRGEESLSVLTLIWTIVLPVKLNAFRSGWRKSS